MQSLLRKKWSRTVAWPESDAAAGERTSKEVPLLAINDHAQRARHKISSSRKKENRKNYFDAYFTSWVQPGSFIFVVHESCSTINTSSHAHVSTCNALC